MQHIKPFLQHPVQYQRSASQKKNVTCHNLMKTEAYLSTATMTAWEMVSSNVLESTLSHADASERKGRKKTPQGKEHKRSALSYTDKPSEENRGRWNDNLSSKDSYTWRNIKEAKSCSLLFPITQTQRQQIVANQRLLTCNAHICCITFMTSNLTARSTEHTGTQTLIMNVINIGSNCTECIMCCCMSLKK